ncbi:MAG: MarR family transcriptional regulator [Sphingobium sp.]|nr:MarR family transcriptional regulator [Sphingobium sp.]
MDTEAEGTAQEFGKEVDLAGWKIDPLDFPTFRIGLLAKIMDRATIRSLSQQTNLSYAQWRVLARLALMAQGGTVSEVASLAWVDRAEVSRAVSALETLGLVGRRDNPADRRASILSLTAAGERVYRDVLHKRRAFHERLLADLSAEERGTLDNLLARIGQRLLGDFGDG